MRTRSRHVPALWSDRTVRDWPGSREGRPGALGGLGSRDEWKKGRARAEPGSTYEASAPWVHLIRNQYTVLYGVGSPIRGIRAIAVIPASGYPGPWPGSLSGPTGPPGFAASSTVPP